MGEAATNTLISRTQTALPPEEVKFTAEARVIQSCAARRIARVVRLADLLFFSSASGDAWVLDPADGVATELAHVGAPGAIPIQESADTLAVTWDPSYRIEGDAFIAIDRANSETRTITDYPTAEIVRLSQAQPALLAKSPALAAARQRSRTGRNDPCPCGSGRKYKVCCRTGKGAICVSTRFFRGSCARPPGRTGSRRDGASGACPGCCEGPMKS